MNELNAEQTKELNRAKKLISYLNTDPNPSIWNIYKPFNIQVNILNDSIKSINNLVPQKEQSGKSVTVSKEDLKKSFSTTVGGFFSIAKQYATAFGDTTLAGQVKMSETDIFALKDSEIKGFGDSLRSKIFTDTLLANTDFMDYGITTDMVDAAGKIADDFNDKIGVSAGISVVSDTANVDITAIIDTMRKCVDTMLGLKTNFMLLNESFVTGLEKAAVRDDIGVRHTGMTATITLDGVGSIGGSITIGKKKNDSTVNGNCKPMYVTHGNKNVTVVLAGFPNKTFKHYFIKGEVDKMTFDFVTPVAVVV